MTVPGLSRRSPRLVAALLALFALLSLAYPAFAQEDAGSYITPFPQGDVYRTIVLGDDLADGLLTGIVDALGTDGRLQIDRKVVSLNGLNRADFADKLKAIDEQLNACPAAHRHRHARRLGPRVDQGHRQTHHLRYARVARRIHRARRPRDENAEEAQHRRLLGRPAQRAPLRHERGRADDEPAATRPHLPQRHEVHRRLRRLHRRVRASTAPTAPTSPARCACCAMATASTSRLPGIASSPTSSSAT